MKSIVLTFVLALGAGMLQSCDDASVAHHNLSKAADNFELVRRIVFYNGITGEYILSVEGRCSFGHELKRPKLTVVCKTGDGEYKKHDLGLSDNVTYFNEQLEGAKASAYHYRVTFKPQVILPDIDFRSSVEKKDLPQTQ